MARTKRKCTNALFSDTKQEAPCLKLMSVSTSKSIAIWTTFVLKMLSHCSGLED